MIIQKYVVILVLGISVTSYAMDSEYVDQNLKNHIAVIGGQIDQQILGINDSAWHTPLVGSCKSFYRSFSFSNNPQEATRQLIAVESVIEDASDFKPKPLLFETLHKNHWHFAYLVNALVDDEVEQLRQVSSLTIDTLCDKERKIPGLSHLLSTFIHVRAYDCYTQEVKLKEPLAHIHFGGENGDQEEIHFAALEEFGHEPCTLIMCNGGKYIRSITPRGKQIIWDAETAMQVEETPLITSEGEQCFSNDYLIDKENSVLATCGHSHLVGWRLCTVVARYYKNNNYDDKPAMLFARPTLTSWLCQQVFLKNRNNKNALIQLRDSNPVKNIKGFPQKNLLKLIERALRKLAEERK